MSERKIDLVGPGINVYSVTRHGAVVIHAEYIGLVECPRCHSLRLRTKDRFVRKLRHERIGTNPAYPVAAPGCNM